MPVTAGPVILLPAKAASCGSVVLSGSVEAFESTGLLDAGTGLAAGAALVAGASLVIFESICCIPNEGRPSSSSYK